MKKAYSLFVALILVSALAAQPCLPEGITFSVQSQIDSFQTNYPNCTEIEGEVNIIGDDITNLNGLNVLTAIEGSLKIDQAECLYNLVGLHNLTYIGGDCEFHLLCLNTLLGLNNLTLIAGDLIFNNIFCLPNFEGLNSLTTIGGNFLVYDNYQLTTFLGLDNLTSVGGIVEFLGNPSLISLNGLENLTIVGDLLAILYNDSLTSLYGLENIITDSLLGLSIHENSLLSICDLDNICNYLSDPSGSVNIYSNASGCNNPPEVASACGIAISCLPYGNYYFFSQNDIDNFQYYFPNCTALEGDVTIKGNDISTLNGLEQVISVGGNLLIRDNDTLSNLIGLQNVNFTGGYMRIIDNEILLSLNGLENLDSIGGHLGIGGVQYSPVGNPSLSDISAIENISYIGGELRIRYNYSLSDCAIQSVCNYLAASNGQVIIEMNAWGCYNQQQVIDSCGLVYINKPAAPNNIRIYPNPSHSSINIELPTQPSKNTTLTISNTNGQQLITQAIIEPQTEIDISHFPAGIYIIKVWNDKDVMVRKIIKQ
jgi:hypothetical protein